MHHALLLLATWAGFVAGVKTVFWHTVGVCAGIAIGYATRAYFGPQVKAAGAWIEHKGVTYLRQRLG